MRWRRESKQAAAVARASQQADGRREGHDPRGTGPTGGTQYLLTQAQSNPNAFLALVGKVLPMTVAGDPANPVRTSIEVAFVERSEFKACRL